MLAGMCQIAHQYLDINSAIILALLQFRSINSSIFITIFKLRTRPRVCHFIQNSRFYLTFDFLSLFFRRKTLYDQIFINLSLLLL